jgi:hypothetical protein
MRDVATLRFSGPTTGGESLAIIRAAGGAIGLCLSSRDDGDLEVFLAPDSTRELIVALQTALEIALPTGVIDRPQG